MKISQRSKKLYEELGKGWNTWDVQSVTAHVYLPDRFRVNIGFFNPRVNRVSANTLWDQVDRFGEHTIDGSYTEVDVCFEGCTCKVETAANDDELLIKISPLKHNEYTYAYIEAGEISNRIISVWYEKSDGLTAKMGDKEFRVNSPGGFDESCWNPLTVPHLSVKMDKVNYFTINSCKDPAEIEKILKTNRERWLESTVRAEGKLGRGLDALRRSLLWNMVYDFTNDRVITPVSRNWCKRSDSSYFGDYVLFGWDTFFAGLQYGLIDKRLAYSSVFSILEEETPEGMIPNFGCNIGLSRDRSEPQVGSLCVWRLYRQFGDVWFVEECFDRLLNWNRWRFRERDFNGDGLLELASTTRFKDENNNDFIFDAGGDRQGAMYESGIDNSPMWDRAVYNTEHQCLELSYVGLNALLVMDCQVLAKMAALLGRSEEQELIQRAQELSDKINNELWDEKTGCYLNKHWSGEFDPCLSLTHFYTITAGIAKDERLEKLLKLMLDEDHFGGEYVIPNVSRKDPGFNDQDYWRGRIWAPTNFLVAEGLLRIRNLEIWDGIIKKGVDLFVDCWDKHGFVGENYNSTTGEAGEKGNSDKFYHWGALLVYMGVMRRLCFNPWEDKTEKFDRPDWLGEVYNIPFNQG